MKSFEILTDAKQVKYLSYICPGCKLYHNIPFTGEKAWIFNDNIKEPSLQPSILASYGQDEICHHFLTNGKISFLSDCTHELKNKTIDMITQKEQK